MSPAVALAAAAGALAVAAGWESLAALEALRLPAAARRALAPLVRAGREGRDPTSAERRRLALLGVAALAAGGWLVAGPRAGVAAGAAGPWLARRAVLARRRRWRRAVGRAAPHVALALADALEAGHAIPGAIAEAARGVGGPAGAELRAAAGALALGEPTERVLERLRARADDRAFDLMVAALLLQRDAGGPLASLLRELAGSLEEGLRLREDARAATAQARFTALLVALLPAGAALLAELGHPGYLGGLLRSPLTAWLVGCAAALQLLGLLGVRRLARVRA
jgi:tight adherence protein B